MNKLKKILGLSLIALSLLIGTSKVLAVQIPLNPEIFETSLAAPMLTTDTSLILANGTYRNGVTPIIGYVCLTVDVNSPQAEFMCGTASSTSVSLSLRGITGNLGTATSSLFIFPHRRGADVRITTYPITSLLAAILNGQLGIPNLINYDSQPNFVGAASTSIATIGFVANATSTGGVPASETLQGTVQLATNLQAASSTRNGSTGARLVIPASLATSSCQVAQFGSTIVSTSTGKLGIGCFDQSLAYTFTGSNIFTASTTFTATTTLATTTVNGTLLLPPKFGGTGADGALTISSGTTTIALGGQGIFTKNYTSISITGTGVLAFSGASTTGTTIILKSQGNVTLTSNAQSAINLAGAGGAAGSGSNSGTGAIGLAGYPANVVMGGTYNGGSSGIGAGGTGLYQIIHQGGKGGLTLLPGSGGAGSQNAGGAGAGAMYIEVGGAYNATSTILFSGTGGANATAGSGAGGGGGGSFVVLYNNLTANTATYTGTGGVGGTGNSGGLAGGPGGTAINGCYGSGAGGASGNVVSGNTPGGGGGAGRGGNVGSGGASGGSTPSAGGGGGGGCYYVAQNTEFN